jgi:hypothetical protein
MGIERYCLNAGDVLVSHTTGGYILNIPVRVVHENGYQTPHNATLHGHTIPVVGYKWVSMQARSQASVSDG